MLSLSNQTVASIAYVALIFGSLITFSIFYRRRKAAESANLEPWFAENQARNIYLSLLHMENPPCPPKLLKAALLERAREDMSRIYSLRESKMAAQGLLQRGSISESTWQQLLNAETEMQAEMQDVIAEAKGLGGEEWAKNIVPQANEYYQKNLVLDTLAKTERLAEIEKVEWEKELEFRKAYEEKQRAIALQELVENNGNVVSVNGDAGSEGMLNSAGGPEGASEKKSKKKKNKK